MVSLEVSAKWVRTLSNNSEFIALRRLFESSLDRLIETFFFLKKKKSFALVSKHGWSIARW